MPLSTGYYPNTGYYSSTTTLVLGAVHINYPELQELTTTAVMPVIQMGELSQRGVKGSLGTHSQLKQR